MLTSATQYTDIFAMMLNLDISSQCVDNLLFFNPEFLHIPPSEGTLPRAPTGQLPVFSVHVAHDTVQHRCINS